MLLYIAMHNIFHFFPQKVCNSQICHFTSGLKNTIIVLLLKLQQGFHRALGTRVGWLQQSYTDKLR